MKAIRGVVGAAALVLRSVLTCLVAAMFLAGMAGRSPAHAAADRPGPIAKPVASIPADAAAEANR